jgi:hypothetical protein
MSRSYTSSLTVTVVTLVAINANENMVAHTVGSGGVYVHRESGVRRGRVCVVAFCRNLVSVAVKLLSYLI